MRIRLNKKGFTLIELLIVVAIIGIIAAIAIPNLLNAIQRGKQKRTMADMRAVGTAVEAYAVDNNFYPAAGKFQQKMLGTKNLITLQPAELHHRNIPFVVSVKTGLQTAPLVQWRTRRISTTTSSFRKVFLLSSQKALRTKI